MDRMTLYDKKDDNHRIHISNIRASLKELKEEFKYCRDKTDIWADERWNKFERLFNKGINKIFGAELI